ncbi:unnamed protein product, partial [Symbiodinium sp. CCMP2456]
VRERGILVYLSGTGADEIISDYGHGGKKIFPHSNFGGLFPEDLGTLFPWEAFFLGTQRDYLMKEELVAGVHGVEARYPFLDRMVVQEKTRRDIFGQGGPKGGIPLLFENLSATRLPLPLRYKHLGVQQMPLGGMLEELRFRTSQARSAFAEARRKVFRSRAIPLRRKAMILASTVLSKLLLGAGSWPPLNKREERLFDGTLWSLYRSVLGIKFAEDQHITASTCFALLQMPDPGVTLRCSRLSYLAQMLRAAPDPLWAIVRADQPYMELLWQDLSWLYAWCHCTMDWPHPRADWGSWATGIVRFPGCAKLFASRHRLRRHLVTSQQCVANWGAFDPASSELQLQGHPLAPPTVTRGAWRQVSHGMEETDFSPTLLASLEELDGCTEEEVWEVVEGVIEPLAVLRATVLCWRNAHPASEWHAMVAENVLLLLDPAVLADSKQATKPRPPKRWDVPPEWTLPGAAPLASTGERVTRTVAAPPPAVLPPYGPQSMPIRLASAYALWLQDVTRFLWLSSEVKNAKYKAPVHDWLARFSYPFRSGEKVGFNAMHNVQWQEDQSLVYTSFAKPDPKDQKEQTEEAGSTGDAQGERSRSEAHELRLKAKEEALAKREADISQREAELERSWRDVEALQSSYQQLRAQAQELVQQIGAQSEAALRVAALRLAPMQQVAQRPFQPWKSPVAALESGEADPALHFDTGHPKWSGVEVLTCVSGGRFVKVMDFPVFHIFRASTPLPVHNVCENHEWDGMHMRLRFYQEFLEEYLASSAGGRQRLFIVSDGMDVIFNDLRQLIDADPNLKDIRPVEAVAQIIIQRYE